MKKHLTKKNLTKKNLLIFCAVLLTIAILVIYNDAIIDWLSQYETLRTLLTNASFWNENVNHWLGDMLTFIGVMLAFSLPFSAQVVQWVVSTYGVASFPNLVDKKLSIQSILPQMFVFVAMVIFWRLFRYDLSPYTQILYLLVNLILAISFIYLSWRLFYIAKLIIQYSFNFENAVIKPTFIDIQKIGKLSKDFLKPENNGHITATHIPSLNDEYLQQIELLRDYELAEYQKGNIHQEYSDFTQDIWFYIEMLYKTNQPERTDDAIKLQQMLSLSIRKMCATYTQSNAPQYYKLAYELSYYTVANAHYFLEKEKEKEKEKENKPSPRNEFDYFADIIYLAKEIETKNGNNDFPVLSGFYLLNYAFNGYLFYFSKQNIAHTDWQAIFENINQLEKEIIELTRKLIYISESNQLSQPLKRLYKNIKNDTQFIHEIDITRYSKTNEGYKLSHQFNAAKNVQDIQEILEIFVSPQFDENFKCTEDEKRNIFNNILKLNYQFKIENLIIYWLGKTSFNSSILIDILEEAAPIDPPKILGPEYGHLIPQSLTEVFHSFFKVRLVDSWFWLDGGSKNYQITYSTITFYLLIREYKNHQRAENVAKDTLHDSNFSIEEIRKIREAAKEWQSSPQGIFEDNNLRQLCLNHGVDFVEMKDFYLQFLVALDENSAPVITKRIIATPLHKDVDNFVQKLEEEINNSLKDYKFDRVNKTLTPKRLTFLRGDRELFIGSDHPYRFSDDSIKDSKKFIFDKISKDKSIISNEEALSCKVRHRESDDHMKVIFYVELNFNFKND